MTDRQVISLTVSAYRRLKTAAKLTRTTPDAVLAAALDAETTRIQALVDRLVSKHIDRRRP